MGFEDERFDESRYQDVMAEALGVSLSRVRVSGRDVAEAFPEVVRMAEKPMLRSAPGPLLRLSRAVHDAGFKVVLTGEGADEIFGGYNIFQEAMVRRFWARQPDSRLRPALLGRRAVASSPSSSGPDWRTWRTRCTATGRASGRRRATCAS
ncbi:MAG: asparagine synthase-related protein [Deinococcales bacterium]